MRYGLLPALVSAGVLCCAQGAYAATLTVDDDKADCPAAAYTTVQAAVDAAGDGDTVVICKGDYAEGTGAPGTNAVTITDSITIKGAGADLVKITPKANPLVRGSILEDTPDLRNGVGDIISIVGTPTQPLTVNISGVTVDGYDPDGREVAVEAGIVFLDAKGSVVRSRVTNVVTSEGDNAYTRVGGWRGSQPGIGIVQTSNALLAPVDGARKLIIDRTRVDKYNKIGILIDGAQNDASPLVASGAVNWGVITASQIIGRTECINYAGTGNCANVGLLTTGPLFGQDGLRVTSGSYATVDSSLISQNLVNGTGAPTRNSDDQQRQPDDGRRRPLRRRQDRALQQRDRPGRLLAPRDEQHRRQRVRRAQRRRRRHHRRHRQPERDRAAVAGQPAQGREQLVGSALQLADQPGPGDLADHQPAGPGEPGQRHRHGRDRQRRDDLQRGRLLPVSQRAAVGSDQRPVPDPDRADPGRRRRPDGLAGRPGERHPRQHGHARRRARATTSASSACASPRARPRSGRPRRRPTRSTCRSRPTRRATPSAPTARSRRTRSARPRRPPRRSSCSVPPAAQADAAPDATATAGRRTPRPPDASATPRADAPAVSFVSWPRSIAGKSRVVVRRQRPGRPEVGGRDPRQPHAVRRRRPPRSPATSRRRAPTSAASRCDSSSPTRSARPPRPAATSSSRASSPSSS